MGAWRNAAHHAPADRHVLRFGAHRLGLRQRVLLIGEAGMGNTAWLEAFAQSVSALGVGVVGTARFPGVLRSLAAPAQRDLPRMAAPVQQLLASGERWCDAKLLALLALLAETRLAQGDPAGARRTLAQAEALLEGMPVHADEVTRVRACLAAQPATA